jgi:hypothetical protein
VAATGQLLMATNMRLPRPPGDQRCDGLDGVEACPHLAHVQSAP